MPWPAYRAFVLFAVTLLMAGYGVYAGEAAAAPPPGSPYTDPFVLNPPVVDAYATAASLSADGRFAALTYTTAGGYLVDTASGQQTPIRLTAAPDSPSSPAHISADGRFLAFTSGFVGADGVRNIGTYQRALATGETALVYPHPPETLFTGARVGDVAQSADGRFVFYATAADDGAGSYDVFQWRRDMTTGQVDMISLDADDQPVASRVRDLSEAVSSNGRYFVFEAHSGGADRTSYVRDLITGTSTIIPGLDDAGEDRIDVTNGGDIYYSGPGGSGAFSAVTKEALSVPAGASVTTVSPSGRYLVEGVGTRCPDGISFSASWTVVDTTTGNRSGLDAQECRPSAERVQFVVTDSGAVLRTLGNTTSGPRVTLLYRAPGGGDTPPPPPPPVEAERFDYVALGDSFSAGEGVEPFWEPADANRCHRSQLAYARHIEQPGIPDASLHDRAATGDEVTWGFQACSGARTWHVLPVGMGGQRNHGDPLPQLEEDRTADTGNPYDLPVTDDTELVTITIGGNNLDFSSLLRVCYTSRDCTRARINGRSLEEEITARLNELGPELDRVYAQIHAQAANARIMVAGYPHLFPATAREQNCPKLRQVRLQPTRFLDFTIGFSQKEQNFLRGQTSRLNQVIADHVNRAERAEFVPVDSIFAGHEVCGRQGEWINALQATPRLPSPVNDQSFHPNERGHELGYAAAINAVLNGTTF